MKQVHLVQFGVIYIFATFCDAKLDVTLDF